MAVAMGGVFVQFYEYEYDGPDTFEAAVKKLNLVHLERIGIAEFYDPAMMDCILRLHSMIDCSRIKTLIIEDCGFGPDFPLDYILGFSGLEHVEIHRCHGIVRLVGPPADPEPVTPDGQRWAFDDHTAQWVSDRGETQSAYPGAPRLVLNEAVICECANLAEIPDAFCDMLSIRALFLQVLPSLRVLPSRIGNIAGLWRLVLWQCKLLEAVPESIGSAGQLGILDITECTGLCALPDKLCAASELSSLKLIKCDSVTMLPENLGNLPLERLQLNACFALTCLPDSLSEIRLLRLLDVSSCEHLASLPANLGKKCKLAALKVNGCSLLESLPACIGSPNMLTFEAMQCRSLRSIPVSLGDVGSRALISVNESMQMAFPPARQAAFGTRAIVAFLRSRRAVVLLILAGRRLRDQDSGFPRLPPELWELIANEFLDQP